jgi:hypothetical protein
LLIAFISGICSNARADGMYAPAKKLAKLTASDGQIDDMLGNSVAVDGNTIVVGNLTANVGGHLQQGAVYVYVEPKNGWHSMTQTAKLTASDGQEFDGFGQSVAVLGDTIAIGAYCHDVSGAHCAGAVYIFEKPKTGWKDMTETAELTSTVNYLGLGLGWSVAIGPDGDVASGAGLGGDGDGAVYIFQKPSSGWRNMTQTAILTASDGEPENALGASVSYVGDTVASGAVGWPDGAGEDCCQGAVYIYTKPASGWKDSTETARITASDGQQDDLFGGAVTFDPDADTLFSGTPGATVNGNYQQGAVYAFSKPAGGWQTTSKFKAKLTAHDGSGRNGFGDTIAAQHFFIAVGAPGYSVFQGAAYLYLKPSNGWKTTSRYDDQLTDTVSKYDFLGGALSLQKNTLVVGADLERPAGAAYVYRVVP